MPKQRAKKKFGYAFPFPNDIRPFRELGFEDEYIVKLCEGRRREVVTCAAKWLATKLPDIRQRTAFLYRFRPQEVVRFRPAKIVLPDFPEDLPPEEVDEFVGAACDILKHIV